MSLGDRLKERRVMLNLSKSKKIKRDHLHYSTSPGQL